MAPAKECAVSQGVALAYNDNEMAVLVLAPTAVLGPYDHEPSLLGGGILKLYRGSIPAGSPPLADLNRTPGLARRELGFHPRHLTETIRDTIAWFKKGGEIR